MIQDNDKIKCTINHLMYFEYAAETWFINCLPFLLPIKRNLFFENL